MTKDFFRWLFIRMVLAVCVVIVLLRVIGDLK